MSRNETLIIENSNFFTMKARETTQATMQKRASRIAGASERIECSFSKPVMTGSGARGLPCRAANAFPWLPFLHSHAKEWLRRLLSLSHSISLSFSLDRLQPVSTGCTREGNQDVSATELHEQRNSLPIRLTGAFHEA